MISDHRTQIAKRLGCVPKCNIVRVRGDNSYRTTNPLIMASNAKNIKGYFNLN